MVRLLLTRPRDDAEALARRLDALGISTLIEPLLVIEVRPEAELALDGVQAVLATSANGIRAFASLTPRRDLPVFTVGPTSARTARELGFRAVEAADGAVEDLARLVATRLDPKRGAVLHIAGSDLAGDLAGDLDRRGFDYRRAVLYSARPATALSADAEQALLDGTLTGALFFSPRTARTFVSLAERQGLGRCCQALTAFCLSAAVAEAAGSVPWGATIVADRPNEAALVAAIKAWARRPKTA